MTKAKGRLAWPIACADCGVGKVRPVARAGRTGRYKTLLLEIPADLAIPTCNKCGAEWIDAQTAGVVDSALEKAFETEVQAQAERLLVEMVGEVTQRRMEAVLGLSQGYLSKVRSGASTPSAMLLACLQLIARDPANRLRELEEAGRSRPKTKAKVQARRTAQRAASAGRR